MAEDIVTVTRSVSVDAPADEVWRLIGDFHGIDRWHPAVATSEGASIGHEQFRMLTTANGARILEHLIDQDTHSYTYSIVRSPLLVANYEARLGVKSSGAQTKVTWKSSFIPKAKIAGQEIASLYEAGLGAVAEHFGA